MEWLTAAWMRSADRLRSLSPTTRVLAGVLAALAVIGLICLKADPLGQRYEYLLGVRDFSDEEIDSMQAAFAQAGLNDWQIEGHRVRVPKAERHAYLAALAENRGMPETFGSASERLLESHHLFESNKVRQFRQRHAMQKELSLIVSRMAGIDMATVKYDEVELGGFPVRVRKTAMVAARAGGGQPLNDQQVGSIRDLVAGAIAGLEVEDVTVTDLGSGRTYRGNAAPGEQAGQSLLAARRDLEASLRDRIAEMLAVYPGIVITVNAELAPAAPTATGAKSGSGVPDANAAHTTAKVATLAQQRDSSPHADSAGETQWTSHAPDGRFPSSIVQLPSADELLRDSRNVGESGAELPSGSDPSAPLLEQVTALVSVPRSYFLQVWRQRQQWSGRTEESGPTAETLNQVEAGVHATIERQVLAMLPAAPGKAAGSPRVVVSTYDDLEVRETPSGAEHAAWNFLIRDGLARNILLLTLAIAAVAVLALLQRRWQKRQARGSEEFETAVDEWPDEPVDFRDDPAIHDAPQALQQELAALIHRDPNAAAGILRDWIGEAA